MQVRCCIAWTARAPRWSRGCCVATCQWCRARDSLWLTSVTWLVSVRVREHVYGGGSCMGRYVCACALVIDSGMSRLAGVPVTIRCVEECMCLSTTACSFSAHVGVRVRTSICEHISACVGWVDAHVAALSRPDAAGHRYILNSGSLWMTDVARALAARYKPQVACVCGCGCSATYVTASGGGYACAAICHKLGLVNLQQKGGGA